MKKFVLMMVALLLCLSMLACDVRPAPPETGRTNITTLVPVVHIQ